MLRIMVELEETSAVVRAEGRVIGAWVEELRRSCEQAREARSALIVDLSAVSFVDRDGVRMLRSLAERGARLVHGSGFVAEALKG